MRAWRVNSCRGTSALRAFDTLVIKQRVHACTSTHVNKLSFLRHVNQERKGKKRKKEQRFNYSPEKGSSRVTILSQQIFARERMLRQLKQLTVVKLRSLPRPRLRAFLSECGTPVNLGVSQGSFCSRRCFYSVREKIKRKISIARVWARRKILQLEWNHFYISYLLEYQPHCLRRKPEGSLFR